MFQNCLRRTLVRVAAGLAGAIVAILLVSGVAAAHVIVQPQAAEGGGFSVIAFQVANERDDANTTQVQIRLPKAQPIQSVKTRPVPGWKISTTTRQLQKPFEISGTQVDTVVSKVTWTATHGGLRPSQVQNFALSLGPLPESGVLVFKALQTYSSGYKVNWNQVSVQPGVTPEHPAPVVTITPAAAEHGSAEAGNGIEVSQDEQITSADGSDNASHWTLPLGVSGIALLVSVASALVAWRRGWRPASPAEADSSPNREDVNV
jgi:periplasmic copper chaperone A